MSCRTIGEAMRLAATLKLTWVPGIPEDEDDMDAQGIDAGDLYEWAKTGPVMEGDWPSMPPALSLSVFDGEDTEALSLIYSDEVGASTVSTVLNGDCIEIPPESEAALVRAFTALGIPFSRDDQLINGLAPE